MFSLSLQIQIAYSLLSGHSFKYWTDLSLLILVW